MPPSNISRLNAGPNPSDWVVESSTSILRREPWLEVFEEHIRLPDGRRVDDFYTIQLRNFVVVAPLTTRGELVVVSHYRHGPRRVTRSLPSGFVEAGEEPAEAAKRELLEETGYTGDSWQELGSYVVDGLWHMVLPLTMLTVFNTATLTLLLRGNLVDVLRQDFIMAARASGLPERRVVLHHALRNAIIPVLTYLGILFGLMLATAPVTETVFTWPGAGALYLAAIQSLDYPVIMGETLVVTVMLVGFTLLTDVAYVLIDPRIRLG